MDENKGVRELLGRIAALVEKWESDYEGRGVGDLLKTLPFFALDLLCYRVSRSNVAK